MKTHILISNACTRLLASALLAVGATARSADTPTLKVWDVVNEAISDSGTNILRNSLWLEIIGPDFIAKAFESAHEADPDAILRYNDFWGVNDANSWRARGRPLLFDGNAEPKAAFDAVIRVATDQQPKSR